MGIGTMCGVEVCKIAPRFTPVNRYMRCPPCYRDLGSSHLGSYCPLTLQLRLVPVECLLAAVFQVGTLMMFRKSMLLSGQTSIISDQANQCSLSRKIELYNVDIAQLCARLRNCIGRRCRFGIDNVS